MAEENEAEDDGNDDLADDTADDLIDDTAEDLTDDTVDGDSSENSEDVPTAMDVNMVFALPAEFRAPEAEVAELVLGPKNATFEKPEKPEQHLKPLFIKGHIDGKPIGRMLVDGGAGVNIIDRKSVV